MGAIIDTLSTKEEAFKNKLKDSSGKVFSLVETIEISPRTKIYRLGLKDTSYYYTTKARKTQICLHFTVGTITGDIATLTKSGQHMSVHYVIDRLGNIYNLIPLDKEKNWSYHVGSGAVGTNGTISKSAIGIEVSNYGPLYWHVSGYYNTYAQLYSTDVNDTLKTEFRGHEYYTAMPESQKNALYDLIEWLCDKMDIPHNYKLEGMFEDDKTAQAFSGIFTHAQVRKDKYDFPYEQIRFVKDWWQESQLPEEKPAEEPVKYNEIKFSEVRHKEQETKVEEPVQETKTVETKPIEKPQKQENTGIIARIIEFLRNLIK